MKQLLLYSKVAFLIFISVAISNAQTCDFSYSSSICINQETIFYAQCEGTISWYVDNVYKGQGFTFQYTFTEFGPHEVTMNYGSLEEPLQGQQQVQTFSGGGSVTKTISVSQGPLLSMVASSESSLCDVGNVALSIINRPAYTYSWTSSPSGFSGTGSSVAFNNITNTTTFTVVASDGSGCTSSRSVQVEVKKTEMSPVVDTEMPYHKRTVKIVPYYTSGHYWQTPELDYDILKPVQGNLTVTKPATYFIRNKNLEGDCWTNPSTSAQVTINYTPPVAEVVEVKKAGYSEIIMFNDDLTHVLTFATYYWVKDNSANPEIISQYNNGIEILNKNLFVNGNYYLKGRDIGTGTWGTTREILNLQLRDDNGLNWIHTKSFDGTKVGDTPELNVVSESKSYFDEAGKPLQSQTKSKATNTIFATQSLKDKYDRVVGSTLPAPIGPKDFTYNSLFIQNSSGDSYNYANFDDAKKLNPDPVDNTQPGTVGWYYSENNTLEKFVPTTSFPYSRTEFYEDGTGEVKRSASPGDVHRLGMGHEVLSGTFPVFGELDDYLAKRRSIGLVDPQTDSTLMNEGVQSIARDENGKYVISISDKNGKGVMTARNGSPINNDWVLKVDNVVKANVNVAEASPDYRKMVYFYILNSQPVQIITGTSSNIAYGGNVSLSEHDPAINTYYASKELRLLPGFSVTGGNIFNAKISNENDGWIVENIVTGEKLPPYQTFADASGNWPVGFYRLTMLTGEVTIKYTNYFLDVSYQFYDDMGRLKTSVSPNGYKKWIANANPNINYPVIDKTTYSYNFRGWLLSMTEPDAGTTTYKYRRDGKIRFSQNAEQANITTQYPGGRFSYTNYDQLGRPVESGEYKGSSQSFGALTSQLEYDQQVAFTSPEVNDWVKTYYDLPDENFEETTGLLQSNFPQNYVRGAVSYTENANIKTWYSYDELGRVTWMAQQPKALSDSTIKRVFVSQYEYDFLGNVLKTSNSMYEDGNEKNKFNHHYAYDADRRLSQVFTSLDGTTKKLRATYKYYLHGPLKRIELGDQVQGIDFVYNIHGWLTQINHPNGGTDDPGEDGVQGANNENFRKDAFGMVLDYYESELSNLFQASVNPTVPDPNGFHQLPITGDAQNLFAYTTEPVHRLTQLDWVSMVKESLIKNKGLYSIDQPSSN